MRHAADIAIIAVQVPAKLIIPRAFGELELAAREALLQLLLNQVYILF